MNKPQTGIRFRSEMLGCSHIQRLAEYVAAEYGLPRVDRKHVRRMYAQATPIPITLENENGQLWVDKYTNAITATAESIFCNSILSDLRAGRCIFQRFPESRKRS